MLKNLDSRKLQILQISLAVLGLSAIIAKYTLKFNGYQGDTLELLNGIFRFFLGISFFVGIRKRKLEEPSSDKSMIFYILGIIFLVAGIFALAGYFLK